MKSTDAARKTTYRNDLFNLIASLTAVDNYDKKGGEVESTLYEDEDDEAEFDEMDEDEEGEFGGSEEEEFEDNEGEMDEEFEDSEEEEEEEKPKKKRKD